MALEGELRGELEAILTRCFEVLSSAHGVLLVAEGKARQDPQPNPTIV